MFLFFFMMYIQYCIHLLYLYYTELISCYYYYYTFFFQIDQIKNEINRNTVIVTDYILTSLEIYVNTSTDTLSNWTIMCVLIPNTCNYRMPNAQTISNVSYYLLGYTKCNKYPLIKQCILFGKLHHNCKTHK